MTSSPLVEATNLSKSFPDMGSFVDVLRNTSLLIHRGESLAITGPSGAGKSTLLHILGTIEAPSSGTLTIAGKNALVGDVASLRNNHIGFIFQNFNLLPDYTTFENVCMPGKIGRRPLNRARAHELLDAVHLSAKKTTLARHLSGGEKQRVALARALYNDPDLILADEPSGNLDEEQSGLVHDLLLTLAKERQKALVIVTHDRALARLCDTTYLLHHAHLTPLQRHVGQS